MAGPEIRRTGALLGPRLRFYRRSAARDGPRLPGLRRRPRNWRDASDAEVRPLLADGVPHAVRFRVPRPDHPVPHVVEDAVRDLRWADVRRTLREDFVLVRRDGAPLYALCAVCGLCGIQAPAPSPRLLDGVVKRAAPSTRAPARRRETSRRAGRRRRARRHHARRPRGGARVERAAPDAAARRARRAAAALRALLARRRPGCVPRRPPSTRAIVARTPSTRRPRADGRKLSKRSAAVATVAALRNDGCTPLGVCAYLAGLGGRAPQSIESLDDLARSFELEGLSAAPSTFDRKQLDERDAAVAFTSKLGAAQLAVAVRGATFRKRVARGFG